MVMYLYILPFSGFVTPPPGKSFHLVQNKVCRAASYLLRLGSGLLSSGRDSDNNKTGFHQKKFGRDRTGQTLQMENEKD